MSYMRIGERREWTEGEPDLYIYPSSKYVQYCPHHSIPKRDFIEGAMRILERQIDDPEVLQEINESFHEELL